jgi:hypothetical protein
MRQSQVWKKRTTGLTGQMKVKVRQWLETNEDTRQEMVAARADQRKAGVKRRRY